MVGNEQRVILEELYEIEIMRLSVFVIFIVTFCYGHVVFGQQYSFRNYSVQDGLAQSQVYAVCEDARGYLWLGTRGGGVSRFDGYNFINFTEDDGLCSNFIRCIEQHPDGSVWIGTDAGLCVYDGKNFKTISLSNETHSINAILFDQKGNELIGTEDSGLFVLQHRKPMRHLVYKNGLHLSDRVNCLIQHRDGSVWIGTEGGPERWDGNESKPINTGIKNGIKSIRAMVQEPSGKVWLATYGWGLYSFTAGDEMFAPLQQDDGLVNNTVHDLSIDRNNALWVATATGVNKIQGEHISTFSEREGLCSNVVMRIKEDTWGNIWMATSGGGICKLEGERFIHYNEKSGNMGTWVYSVVQDRTGRTWFATSAGGVTMYDGTYYTNYFEGAGFTSAKVKCIYEDRDGDLWFGTVGEGAYQLHDNSFTHYDKSNGLTGLFVNDFTEDTLGRIWMATAGSHLFVLDKSTKKMSRVSQKQDFNASRVLSLTTARDGAVWAGTQEHGILVIEYDSVAFNIIARYNTSNGLPANMVRSINSSASGEIIAGTGGGGVVLFKDGTMHIINKKQGLHSNNIYLVITDSTGQIWAGSEKGLDRFTWNLDTAKIRVRHYGKGEGLRGVETSQNAACLGRNGQIWFGTIYGAARYQPNHDHLATTAPLLHLTGIRLFFNPIQSTPYGQSSIYSNWFAIPDSLVLPFDQNTLRFEFIGIDLLNPEGVRYRWRLLGLDDNWSPATDERSASFSNLQHGEYVFQVQTKNADGVWSDIRDYAFIIQPPFWATWTFRIAAGAIIVVLLLLLFYWRLKVSQRANIRKLQQLQSEKQVIELEQKALLLQMNPHFIFNALQSINGYIAQNDTAEARRYLAKFSKLMRLTLENSRQPFVSVKEEVDLLYHYTALEAIGMGHRFTTQIEVDEQIDEEATYIPGMLIQPFVENAIIHGLKHKIAEAGRLTICFNLERERSFPVIVVTIEDNGVGRAQAAQYNEGIRKEHRSAAVEITSERLQRMNEAGKAQSTLTITDLYAEDGSPNGTRVIIRIGNCVIE